MTFTRTFLQLGEENSKVIQDSRSVDQELEYVVSAKALWQQLMKESWWNIEVRPEYESRVEQAGMPKWPRQTPFQHKRVTPSLHTPLNILVFGT